MNATKEQADNVQHVNLLSGMLRAWNIHDKEGVLSYYSPQYTGLESSEANEQYGLIAVDQMVEKFFKAFPDLQVELIDSVSNGSDRMSIYWRAIGHQHGTILNIPPTGKPISVQGVSFFHFNKEGKIIRGAHLWDMAGMLRDLGLLPRLA